MLQQLFLRKKNNVDVNYQVIFERPQNKILNFVLYSNNK